MALSAEEIQTVLNQHPAWNQKSGKLARTWTFPDFLAALAFVNRVAVLAEQANHHPDIDIRYNRVELGLISHDQGGITRRDAAMVKRIDEEFPG